MNGVGVKAPSSSGGIASPRRGVLPGTITNPGAVCAKEHQYKCALPQLVRRSRTWHQVVYNIKRLSATDISALASMKNVAKCDTWCELQNPVNHRVFERKLRPKPLGRGHACLGVTHRVSPHHHVWKGRRMMASHASPGVDGLNKEPPVTKCRGNWWNTRPSLGRNGSRAHRSC